MQLFRVLALYCLMVGLSLGQLFAQNTLQSSDLYKLRAVVESQISPDGARIAYAISNNAPTGRPYAQLWIMNVADGKSFRIGGEDDRGGNATWSPDGKWIAFEGTLGGKGGLCVARADGSGARFLHEMEGTNSPLPSTGKTIAWSPDSRQIGFVSATPGPETKDVQSDPIVITRYLYKPDFAEGNSHFNDNRRLHIFLVDPANGNTRQLTDGTHYEHSIDWSPDGKELLFISNREPNEDQFFNYDVFALKIADGSIRRLTATENAEYRPLWSPDGAHIIYQATRRGLTDLETTMEDTHVWTMDADGNNRRELGGSIDDRQGAPVWSHDGKSVFFTVQERGSTKLYRLPVDGGAPQVLVGQKGSVGDVSIAANGRIAYNVPNSFRHGPALPL